MCGIIDLMDTISEYPPDYATPVGQVRALIPDIETLEDPADLAAEPSYIFNDAVLQSYLALTRGNVYTAAAIAVNALATTEALILKVLKSDDRQTDGAKLADALGKRADWLRAEGEREDEDGALSEAFNIVPFYEDPPLWGAR